MVFAFAFESHHAVDKCEQCVVFADTDVVAGMEFGAALTHENVTCQHELSVGTLGPQSLRRALATVVRGTRSFL